LAITEFPGVERLVISGIRASASFVDRHQSERSSVYRASERAERPDLDVPYLDQHPADIRADRRLGARSLGPLCIT